MIKLSFCQNDSLVRGSFWQKDSLTTQTLFELWLITLLRIVQVVLKHTLEQLEFKLEKMMRFRSMQEKLEKNIFHDKEKTMKLETAHTV